jgi:hypothetical protein
MLDRTCLQGLIGATAARITGRCAVRQSVKVWFIHGRFLANFSMDARENLYIVVSLHGELG